MSTELEKRHIQSSRRGSSIGISHNPLDDVTHGSKISSAGIKFEDLTSAVLIDHSQLKILIDLLSPLT